MVGRDVLLRVEKPPGEAGRAAARGRGPARSRRARPRGGPGRLASRSARARSSASRAWTATARRELIDAIAGPARARPRARIAARRARRHAARPPARRSTPASGTSPRTASAAGSCSTSRSPRTSRCTTSAKPPDSRFGWLFPRRLDRARAARCSRSSTSAAAARDARGRALGRQPAEGRGRARDRARPARSSIAAQPTRGPRRRRDRVRAPPARPGARRGPRDPARLLRARRDPLASRTASSSCTRDEIVGEYAPGRLGQELGLAMTGGARGGGRLMAPASRGEPASIGARRRRWFTTRLGRDRDPDRRDRARLPDRRPGRR